VYSTGSSCLPLISELDNAAKAPTLVFVDVPYKEAKEWWACQERNLPLPAAGPGDIYGIQLLTHLATEIRVNKLSKLIIPIAVIEASHHEPSQLQSSDLESPDRQNAFLSHVWSMRLVDAGAVDIITRPFSVDRVRNLAILGHRIFRDCTRSNTSFLTSKRARNMSWVGIDPDKPYAYLQEAMVSNLMSGICSQEPDPQFDGWNVMRNA
jgi:3',5'-cyclic-nucleotide phosphodiesterase